MEINAFEIEKAETYKKAIKKLKKRFRKIESDVDSFLESLEKIDSLGVLLSNGIYKARIQNSDKNSGKSGGYRLISYIKILDKKLILVYIYDKSDFENLSENEIDKLVLEAIAKS